MAGLEHTALSFFYLTQWGKFNAETQRRRDAEVWGERAWSIRRYRSVCDVTQRGEFNAEAQRRRDAEVWGERGFCCWLARREE